MNTGERALDALLTQLATPIEREPPQPGARVGPEGRYHLLGRLGRGGQGVVFDAHDELMDRKVAVKFIRPDPDDSPEHWARRCERFDREIAILARLQHEHIVTTHDRGRWQELPFLVMERLEGQTLRDLMLRQRRLSPLEAAQLSIQVARGLQAAHEAAVVHRDLKPENIFIQTSGRVRILDFGLARVTSIGEPDPRQRSWSNQAGTDLYMAPEQWQGERQDHRADIWALGVILFEMLTGAPPFSDKLGDLLQEVLSRHPAQAPLRRHGAIIPAPLRAIIEGALQRSPEDRHGEVRAMRAALEVVEANLIQHEPLPSPDKPLPPLAVIEGSPAARPLSSPSAPGRRRWIGASMALVVMFALGISVVDLHTERVAYLNAVVAMSLTLEQGDVKACIPDNTLLVACLFLSDEARGRTFPWWIKVVMFIG